MAGAILTVERLRELLDYDPDTGVFTRKVRTAQRHQVGSRADFLVTSGDHAGYYRVSVDSLRYMAHRVVWLYVFGEWPIKDMDHRDGDRGNNRLWNLRDVSNRINRENLRTPRKDNTSGYLGVTYVAKLGKWEARIQVAKKTRHLGMYEGPEAAYIAYVKAKRKYHEGCTL